MYMSKILMNPGPWIFEYLNKQGKGNLYYDHQMLWQLFPDDPDAKRDFLYRKEIKGSYPVYYIVSKRIPVSGESLFHIETKEYTPKIRKEQIYSFCLRVNPVIAKKEENCKNSKRHDIWMNAWREGMSRGFVGEKLTEFITTQAKQWLVNRGERLGFSISQNDIILEGYTRHRFFDNKMKRAINIGVLDYCGTIQVTDEKIMLNTLFNGIGKSKAFGCGLLLIKRI